jgi:hypothetical protein
VVGERSRSCSASTFGSPTQAAIIRRHVGGPNYLAATGQRHDALLVMRHGLPGSAGVHIHQPDVQIAVTADVDYGDRRPSGNELLA